MWGNRFLRTLVTLISKAEIWRCSLGSFTFPGLELLYKNIFFRAVCVYIVLLRILNIYWRGFHCLPTNYILYNDYAILLHGLIHNNKPVQGVTAFKLSSLWFTMLSWVESCLIQFYNYIFSIISCVKKNRNWVQFCIHPWGVKKSVASFTEGGDLRTRRWHSISPSRCTTSTRQGCHTGSRSTVVHFLSDRGDQLSCIWCICMSPLSRVPDRVR